MIDDKDMLLTDDEIYEAARPHTDEVFWVVEFDRSIAQAQHEKDMNHVTQKGRVCPECLGNGGYHTAFHSASWKQCLNCINGFLPDITVRDAINRVGRD